MKVPDSALSDVSVCAKILGELSGSEGLSVRSKRDQRPKKPLDRMSINRHRCADLEILAPMRDEKDRISVAADAQKPLSLYSLVGLEVVETSLNLLYDRLHARRVEVFDELARSLRVFVFDDDAAVLAVNAASRKPILVPPPNFDIGILQKGVNEPVALMPDILFRACPFGAAPHLLGHAMCMVADDAFKVGRCSIFRFVAHS